MLTRCMLSMFSQTVLERSHEGRLAFDDILRHERSETGKGMLLASQSIYELLCSSLCVGTDNRLYLQDSHSCPAQFFPGLSGDRVTIWRITWQRGSDSQSDCGRQICQPQEMTRTQGEWLTDNLETTIHFKQQQKVVLNTMSWSNFTYKIGVPPSVFCDDFPGISVRFILSNQISSRKNGWHVEVGRKDEKFHPLTALSSPFDTLLRPRAQFLTISLAIHKIQQSGTWGKHALLLGSVENFISVLCWQENCIFVLVIPDTKITLAR